MVRCGATHVEGSRSRSEDPGATPGASTIFLTVPFAVRIAASALLASAWGCASAPLVPSSVALRPPVTPLPGAVSTVVIDAGHGGHDPGASHFGLQEKHLALDIAKRLAARLEEAGLTVVMTRETDRFIPLSRRAGIANRAQADLFVSIHLNANPRGRVSGIEVYYPRGSVVSSQAPWPPSVYPSEVGIPTTAVKQVLWDLVLRETRAQSRALASAVCRAMEGGLGSPCRTVKPARFVVLREAWMPAVLVEVGYLSNGAEAQRLGSAEYRQAAAATIAAGVIAYIRELGVQHI